MVEFRLKGNILFLCRFEAGTVFNSNCFQETLESDPRGVKVYVSFSWWTRSRLASKNINILSCISS